MKASFVMHMFDLCLHNTADHELLYLVNPNDKTILDYFHTREEAWIFFDKWCEKHLSNGWVDDPECLTSKLCEGICD